MFVTFTSQNRFTNTRSPGDREGYVLLIRHSETSDVASRFLCSGQEDDIVLRHPVSYFLLTNRIRAKVRISPIGCDENMGRLLVSKEGGTQCSLTSIASCESF